MLTRSTLSDVVVYAQRTLAECTQFLCAGRAGFQEILQNFRANYAQNLHHLDVGLARYLALERISNRRSTSTKFCASRNHAGRVHAFSVRAAERRNFSGILQFFRASWAQNLRDPDAGRFLFRI